MTFDTSGGPNHFSTSVGPLLFSNKNTKKKKKKKKRKKKSVNEKQYHRDTKWREKD